MDQRIYLNGKKMALKVDSNLPVRNLFKDIGLVTNLNESEFYLTQNGKILDPTNETLPSATHDIHINLRLLGGKGGFGSMLRAIGAQIEKTTNREACRDLSGRRLRDINEEKRLKAWLDKQKDREQEAEEKRKRKLQKLLAVPKHEFKDGEYETARSELTEKVSEAVEEGFRKASSMNKDTSTAGIKRKATANASGSKSKVKKAALWFGDDDLSSSTDTEDDSDPEIAGESPSSCSAKSTNTKISKTSEDSGTVGNKILEKSEEEMSSTESDTEKATRSVAVAE